MVNISILENGQIMQTQYSSSFVKSGISLFYGRSVSIFKGDTSIICVLN